jgi:prevent-host-death family protein
MARRYSIAQARNNLAAIVHELEHLEALDGVEITRRGESVAVLISKQEYDRLRSSKTLFSQFYPAFRERANLEELNIDPDEIWGDVRDKSPGREVDL